MPIHPEQLCCWSYRQATEVRDELSASEDHTRHPATAAAIKTPDPVAWTFLLLAWLVALAATLGALFIGEVMGQAPCNLCWLQRAFIFPLAIVLMVACLVGDFRVGRYALPLAAIGWLVALYHMLLFAGVIPEEIKPCGAGPSCSSADTTILGWLPIPALSLAAFTAIIVLLFLVRRRSP
jgi:disulfide bond formation protein DsbB